MTQTLVVDDPTVAGRVDARTRTGGAVADPTICEEFLETFSVDGDTDE